MQVLLLQDIKGLGKKGEIVKVADGFATNSLIPQKKAALATPGIQAKVNAEIKNQLQKAAKLEKDSNELKEKIERKTFTVHAKVADGGHLFGAIREQQIAEAVTKSLGKNIEKSQVVMPEPIKTVGEFAVVIKLGSVQAKAKIVIVG
jgi:large subunit ribosomal protein L9